MLLGLAIVASSTGSLIAGDWPAWRGDAGHTATSPDALPARLHLQWSRQYPARIPVWSDPLNRDLMPYDRVFEPVVAGGKMFVGFNDADKVVALDVETGDELWSFYTDGPVRFSPTVSGGFVYVTSDDGYLYCLAAADGKLCWRVRGGSSDRQVIGNERIVSSWPARGGPVLAGDTVYFAAGIWPFMGTFVHAVDATTGQVRWVNDDTSSEFQQQPHSAPSFAGVAPQGQLAVAGDLLLVPGGRTPPAAFDRGTGRFAFFQFGDKGEGGSFVAATEARAFVHTRIRGTFAMTLPDGKKTKFRVNEPVLAGELLYAAAEAAPAKDDQPARPPTVVAYDDKDQKLWEVAADGTGDLILAGTRLYAAGQDAITAIDLPGRSEPARIAWSLPVTGQVVRLLAAADRLFAVTLDGRILGFGEKQLEPRLLAQTPAALSPSTAAAEAAGRMLRLCGRREGYALWYGLDDPELLEAVVMQSELQVLAVDPSAEKVDRLRRHFDGAGLYGGRVALRVGAAGELAAPPYIADLVYVSRSSAPRLARAETLHAVYESVRPYGGKLWIDSLPPPADGAGGLAVQDLPKARLETLSPELVITREGALPGAADWNHAYGNVANTVKSDDERVKLPLGILWFGGPSNTDALPRHGHGPGEQVVGGRLFLEGMNCLSARDVYTGRVLWKREFAVLGTFQVYFDETYAETPLTTAYNQVHIPGANARGTNFVATDAGVYLVVTDHCLLLDPATGETRRQFTLPAGADGNRPEWGYVGVYEDLLLAGSGFGNYSERLGYKYEAAGKKGVAWAPDHSGSLGLVAFDRNTGDIRWQVQAAHSFLHNGIVAGGGRVYLLDKLPKRVEEQNRRRGTADPSTYRLLAVDAATGETVWSVAGPFGSWLSYSASRDLLLE
ncbi:MAG: outer membrane protein assembly factor BamB family protein, partial [Thermoguttaceae bacterium]